jgi:hypothetical protein
MCTIKGNESRHYQKTFACIWFCRSNVECLIVIQCNLFELIAFFSKTAYVALPVCNLKIQVWCIRGQIFHLNKYFLKTEYRRCLGIATVCLGILSFKPWHGDSVHRNCLKSLQAMLDKLHHSLQFINLMFGDHCTQSEWVYKHACMCYRCTVCAIR